MNTVTYGILFIVSPFDEFSHLEYEHVPIYYRVHQAEYGLTPRRRGARPTAALRSDTFPV